jgi:hypothetical protein
MLFKIKNTSKKHQEYKQQPYILNFKTRVLTFHWIRVTFGVLEKSCYSIKSSILQIFSMQVQDGNTDS